jgi:peptidoglycan/LPS O-acetylase OafA/YrhL
MELINKSLSYRADIDGIRGIAVLSALIYHAFPNVLPSGFIGADIFFVLSGFLITHLILDRIDEKRFSLFEFYEGRVRRIFPTLILVLLTILILGWFVFLSNDYNQVGRHVLFSATFIQNLNLINGEIGYFDIDNSSMPLMHLWSISIEEQFYIFWPILVGTILRNKRKTLFALVSIITILSFFYNYWLAKDFDKSIYFLFQTRAWEITCGSLLVIFLKEFKSSNILLSNINKPIFHDLISVVGLILILISFIIIDKNKLYPGTLALLPVSGTVLLILSRCSKINRYLLSFKPLVWFGLISYSLYLWHMPLLSFLRLTSNTIAYESNYGIIMKILAIAISILISYLTWRHVETPIRILSSRKSIFVTLSLFFLLSGTAILGWWVQNQNGVTKRLASNPIGIDEFIKESPSLLRPCKFNEIQVGKGDCLTNKPLRDQNQIKGDVVVIGDSTARSSADGLADYYSKKNRFVHIFKADDVLGLKKIQTTKRSLSNDFNGSEYIDKAFEWADTNGAKTVVLVSLGYRYLNSSKKEKSERRFEIFDMLNLKEADSEKNIETGIRRSFQYLKERKIETIFFHGLPEMSFLPLESCFNKIFSLLPSQIMSPCATPRTVFEKAQQRYMSIVKKVLLEYPEVKTFDPSKFLCNSHLCYAIKNDKLIYSDRRHYTRAGSIWLSQYFDF